MRTRLLHLSAISLIAIGCTAFAQDRVVPTTHNALTMSFSPVVKQVSPAVVNIYTKRVVTKRVNPFINDPLFRQFFGDMGGGLSRQQLESSLGSGVIVDADGLVVTNAHVVKDAEEIVAVLNDGRELDATLVLADERSDIAVLRISDKEALPYAPLKPSENLEVGDIVIAIGNPFGVGQTVTSGIVSALARSTLDINDFNFFIQTDAAINPGNSGGPLVTTDGGVVGINTAIYSRTGGSLGIGFAVPSEMVATVVAAAKTGKDKPTIVRTWVGVGGQAVTSDIAESLGLNRPTGVLINALHPASPLVAKGIKVGDVVTAINGRAIRDPAEMKFRLATIPLGDKVTIDYLSRGKSEKITVEAIAPPDSPARQETELKENHILAGVKVANINPAVGVELNLNKESGVVVTGVAEGRRVSRLLRAGDVIFALNNKEIQNVRELEEQLKAAQAQALYALVIERNGQKTQIVVR